MKSFFCNRKKTLAWLSVLYRILFLRSKHFIFISLTEDEVIKLLVKDRGPWDMKFTIVGLQEYNAKCLLKDIGSAIDINDLVLEKALFENKAEEFAKEKQKN